MKGIDSRGKECKVEIMIQKTWYEKEIIVEVHYHHHPKNKIQYARYVIYPCPEGIRACCILRGGGLERYEYKFYTLVKIRKASKELQEKVYNDFENALKDVSSAIDFLDKYGILKRLGIKKLISSSS